MRLGLDSRYDLVEVTIPEHSCLNMKHTLRGILTFFVQCMNGMTFFVSKRALYVFHLLNQALASFILFILTCRTIDIQNVFAKSYKIWPKLTLSQNCSWVAFNRVAELCLANNNNWNEIENL